MLSKSQESAKFAFRFTERVGGVVERAGLENRRPSRVRGFESLTLCSVHLSNPKTPQILSFEGFFVLKGGILCIDSHYL